MPQIIEIIDLTANKFELPNYKYDSDAGMDVVANIDKTITLFSGESRLIPTGIKVNIPTGYEIQVRPRSGLALKNQITVLNSPGTIDSGYTNEIGIILINHSKYEFNIVPGMRIAQIVLNKFEKIIWNQVTSFEKTDRGEKGFGSTGT